MKLNLLKGVTADHYDEKNGVSTFGARELYTYDSPRMTGFQTPRKYSVGIHCSGRVKLFLDRSSSTLEIPEINRLLRLYESLKEKYQLYLKISSLLKIAGSIHDVSQIRENVRKRVMAQEDLIEDKEAKEREVEKGVWAVMEPYGLDVVALTEGQNILSNEINAIFMEFQKHGVVEIVADFFRTTESLDPFQLV